MHHKTIINAIMAIVLSTALCIVDVCPAFAQKVGSGMAASTAVSDQFAESGVNANEANSAGSSADNTSSTGSPVRDTLMVSPMPSARRVPIPTADLMVPSLTVPASVTPR